MINDQHRTAGPDQKSEQQNGQSSETGWRWLRAGVATLLQYSASLYLAVPLISLVAVVLAWATFVESKYDDSVSRFAVYGTGWFRVLGILLAINVAAAVVVRFPWRLRLLGFLLTHAGIIVLLGGFLVSQLWGVHARLGIFEGQTAHTIEVIDRDYFELHVQPRESHPPQDFPAQSSETREQNAGAGPTEPILVPFVGGPFNWEDYQQLGWFPWRLAFRSHGVLYDRDGIRLEVLDYCSHSRRQSVPSVTLRVALAEQSDDTGPHEPWSERVTLSVRGGGPHAAVRPSGVGQSQHTQLGPRVAFWMSSSPEETAAFLNGLPDGQLSAFGQVVFWRSGEVFRIPLEQFQRGSRQPLGNSGVEVELMAFDTESQAIRFVVHGGQEKPESVILYPNAPELNKHDLRRGVYGSYWVDVSAAHAALEGRDGPLADNPRSWRIDIIQGHDRRLYYRTWRPPKVEIAAAWPDVQSSPDADGNSVGRRSAIRAFSQLVVELEEFLPAERPSWLIRPQPFVKARHRSEVPQRRALVRLSVDDTSEEFWLAAEQFLIPLPDDRVVVQSSSRQVTVLLRPLRIELGFAVHLRQFRQQLEPGSRKAESFESHVDFLRLADAQSSQSSSRTANEHHRAVSPKSSADATVPDNAADATLPNDSADAIAQNVVIAMNAPADVTDPATGRSYRFFQEGRWGPVRPGWPEYENLVNRFGPRERFWLSWLAVSYDPGRGLKYAGSLLIVAGIAVVYYFRGYLARKNAAGSSAVAATSTPQH